MSEDEETLAQVAQIGGRVRKLRLRNGLTLEALASEASLSVPHLSRFERGKRAISVGSLIRIAEALDTPVGQLMGQSPAENMRSVVQADAPRRRVAASEGGYEYVCLGSSDTHSAFLIEMRKGRGRMRQSRHAGSEMIYVLEGMIFVELPDERIELTEGRALTFSGTLPHRLEAYTDQARFLIFVAASGILPEEPVAVSVRGAGVLSKRSAG